MTQVVINHPRGASGPDKIIPLRTSAGTAIDLTSVTAATLVYYASDDGYTIRNGATRQTVAVTVYTSVADSITAASGYVLWAPESPLTDTVCQYVCEIHFSTPSEANVIVPSEGYFQISIDPSLAA